MAEPDYVYWFERHGRGNTEVGLNAVPVVVGPKLNAELFSRGIPIVVTSATLAINNDMEFFKQRIGAGNADSLILDSPFDFQKQVTIYIPSDIPSPKDHARFMPEAAKYVREYVTRTEGRAFVLFTSYSMMHDMADLLQNFFEEAKLTLLVQGDGMPRSKMLEAFRKDVSSVLFGTASFWTGVDVPGEALSNVIIMRLPFSVPDHPLVAARIEQAEREGRNAFRDYSLPDAILRFRQGFGRLIRTREDTGIVVVLDSRIVKTSYGRAFLKAVPDCTVEIL
jgi:ATP-dependent DNA helicase DinG